MTQASEAARKATTAAAIQNAPLAAWPKMTAPPPLPVLLKRDGRASFELVGILRENLRVRTNKHDKNTGRAFVEQPDDTQAAKGRRKGDVVFLRLSEKLTTAAKYALVDGSMNFVPEDFVVITGGRVTSKQKQRIARLFYHEQAVRNAVYNRDAAVYVARVNLFCEWYPAAAAEVPKVMTREDARAAVKRQLKKAKDVLAEFDETNLDQLAGRCAEIRARELRELRDGLVEHGCETVERLDAMVSSVPDAAPFVDFEIFEDGTGAIDDNVVEMQDSYASVEETRAAARAALTSGLYHKKRVTKGRAVQMAKILGWDRVAFVANRPGYAGSIKGMYW